MSKIVIGIPCYGTVASETLEDYMRFTYYLGRRTEHEFYLAIKPKSEQFRARNAIVDVALQVNADYLLFLDDDHVINWEESFQTSERYGFVDKLHDFLEEDRKRGIIGALYYKRGGDCGAVIMKQGKDDSYYFMRDDEILDKPQEVAVQGGGCMLINMDVFTTVPGPWFEPEQQSNGASLGTDIQICKKASENGFSIWSDTSVVLGHVMDKREVVTSRNRHRIITESASVAEPGQDMHLMNSAFNLYRTDVEEYMKLSWQEIEHLAKTYDSKNFSKIDEDDMDSYYRSVGPEQLARQALFHSKPVMLNELEIMLNTIDTARDAKGLDFGCGSAPVGFELMLRGHMMDFVDLDGTPAYEFTKWRTKKRSMSKRAGFKVSGKYDYIMFMDSIEHIKDWEPMLEDVCSHLRNDGVILTNYFLNEDFENPEHVSMDQTAVQQFLVSKGIYPVNKIVWVKRDLGFMDKEVAA